MKLTAIYESDFSTFIQVNELKSILLNLWENRFSTSAELEWFSIYCDDPEEHFKEYGYVGLMGLDNMIINLSPKLCEFQTEIDWHSFLTSSKVQEVVQSESKLISKLLGNPIYLPDSYGYSSYVFNGKSYSDVLSSLFDKYGEPCKRIEEMLIKRELYWETTGYFIDSLID